MGHLVNNQSGLDIKSAALYHPHWGFSEQLMWLQKTLVIRARKRGFHLITDELLAQLPELLRIKIGLAHLMLLHTSASLSLNENADPSVRMDLETHLNSLVPQGQPYYRHTLEGADDMPAHIKAALLGVELTVPISCGRLQLGTWQGIYLGEHRDNGGERSVTVTLNGACVPGDVPLGRP